MSQEQNNNDVFVPAEEINFRARNRRRKEETKFLMTGFFSLIAIAIIILLEILVTRVGSLITWRIEETLIVFLFIILGLVVDTGRYVGFWR